MYNSTNTAERIKLIAKLRKIPINKMLIDCELNKNTIFTMQSRGSWLQANSLAKIADYLDCSVDYLLGRSDETHMLISSAKDNAVAINQSGSGTVTIKNGRERELTKQEEALLQMYNNADDKTQVKIMQFMYDLEEGSDKK